MWRRARGGDTGGVAFAQTWAVIALLAAALFALVVQARRLDQRMNEGFAELRGEFGNLGGEFATLRGEFDNLGGEFSELRAEFSELRAEFRMHQSDHRRPEE